MRALRLALDTARSLCRAYSSRSRGAFWYWELLPGPVFCYCCSDRWFRCFYQCFLGTYYHYCGTCRMVASAASGSPPHTHKDTDPAGVVDESLRVLV